MYILADQSARVGKRNPDRIACTVNSLSAITVPGALRYSTSTVFVSIHCFISVRLRVIESYIILMCLRYQLTSYLLLASTREILKLASYTLLYLSGRISCRDRVTMGAQSELIRMIFQKIYKSPSFAPAIMDLHHGSYSSVGFGTVDNKPVIDT
jgi:hypothetical protein